MKSNIKVKKIAYDKVRLAYVSSEPNLCLIPYPAKYSKPCSIDVAIPLNDEEEEEVYWRLISSGSVVWIFSRLLNCNIIPHINYSLENYLVEKDIEVALDWKTWRKLKERYGRVC